MNLDISHILDTWDYQPGQVVVRKCKGKDGSERIQLRVDLGLLQMHVTGRPDGKRPYGHESLYDYYRAKLAKESKPDAAENQVQLDAEACSRLHQEIVQFHHRYICLYQLGDYEAVIRDTNRNESTIQFVQQHAKSEELALPLLLFKPQLMMMRVRARAAVSLSKNNYDEALEIIQAGVDEINEFSLQAPRADFPEPGGEARALEAWMEEIRAQRPAIAAIPTRPLSEREKLENELNAAVASEEYEKAARVRDALKNLKH